MKNNCFLRIIVVCVLVVSTLLSACSKKTSYQNGKVYVYNAGEYIDPEVIESFEEEYGVEVVYDTFETLEDMYPRVKMGAAKYDVICPSDYMIEKMLINDLLEPIDFSQVPLMNNIDPYYWDFIGEIDDKKYSVPYFRGTVGILYNKTLLDEKGLPYPKKWADLWNPVYKGEILMQNSVRDAMMVALKKNGFSMNTSNKQELDIAIDDLIAQKPLVQAYVVDQARDKMIAGEAMMAVVYSGEVLFIQDNAPDFEYEYVIPEEGTNVWLDCWVMTKNCENKENALKWLNYMCKEDIAVKNAEYITYETPNKAAEDKIDPKAVLDKSSLLKDYSKNNNEIYRYLGDEIDELYNERWKKLKVE